MIQQAQTRLDSVSLYVLNHCFLVQLASSRCTYHPISCLAKMISNGRNPAEYIYRVVEAGARPRLRLRIEGVWTNTADQ